MGKLNLPKVPAGSDLEALFLAVGFIVIQWGQAEQSFDLATNILFGSFDGKRFAKRMPKMLETKIEFFKKMASNTPKLSHLKTAFDSLSERFERLAATRHAIIHGAIASIEAENGEFKFIKLHAGYDIHFVNDFHFKFSEFPTLSKELLDLGADMARFAHQLKDISEERP